MSPGLSILAVTFQQLRLSASVAQYRGFLWGVVPAWSRVGEARPLRNIRHGESRAQALPC